MKSKLDQAQAKIADLEARLSKSVGGLDKLDAKLNAELAGEVLINNENDDNSPKDENSAKNPRNPTEATGLRNRKNNILPEKSKPMSFEDETLKKDDDPDTNSDNPISVDELKDILSQVSSLRTLSESYKSGKGW